MNKAKVLEDLYTCASCGYCRFGCPVYKEVGLESASVRGKCLLLKDFLEGRIEYSDKIRDALYMCAQCENCKVNCPTGVDFVAMTKWVREELLKAGQITEGQEMLRKIIAEKGNPFNEPSQERGAWAGSKFPVGKKCENLYFVSCTASYSLNRIAKSIFKVLEEADFEFTLLGEKEKCCGNPLLGLGEYDKARELMYANVAAFDELGVKTIFTGCPGCYKVLKHYYPHRYRVLHIVQLIDELIRQGRLVFDKELKKKIVYFDGCDLGRHCGIYEEPRNVLRAIPGVELIELDFNRDQAVCCGGPITASYPELSARIASRTVKEAVEKGADMLVAACAACLLNFKEGSKWANLKIDIQDIMLLLPKHVGKKPAKKEEKAGERGEKKLEKAPESKAEEKRVPGEKKGEMRKEESLKEKADQKAEG